MTEVLDHDAPPGAVTEPPPLTPSPPAARRSAAEEARTLLAANRVATLATLCEDGSPWASLVVVATVGDGTPVLTVSTLAQHGRNLARDPRASLAVADPAPGRDPLDSGRVTLAGRAEEPAGAEAEAAQAAFLAAAPASAVYGGFGDFTQYVLRVERVRWVGGYGRMDSADPAAYAAAQPDPVVATAAHAARHLNEDHADVLVLVARALAGYDDATAATCARVDRYGLDLRVATPRGRASARVAFAEPVTEPGGLRAASVELARRARGVLAERAS
jgi:heme iron utilization protein